jgi:hypothetical protein
MRQASSRWSMGPRAAAFATTIAVVALAAPSLVPVAGAAARRPSCTRRALQAGLQRGTAKVPDARVARPFGCDDGWAYAAVNTRRFTATSLFRAESGRWVTVPRTRPCARRAVPRRIRRRACDTN